MRYLQDYWDDIKRVCDNIPNIETLFKKRVLITGATGMICSAIVEVLIYLNREKEAKVQLILAGRNKQKIIDRFRGLIQEQEFEFVEYDATEFKKLDICVDYIIHGAGNANPTVYAKHPVETLLGNIVGLDSLLKVVRRNPGTRLLYISSSEVYGNRINNTTEPYKEGDYGFVDILNSRACYPNGKRTAETLCICYGQEYDVNTVIARPGHIYGPTITKADMRASAIFTRNVASGKNIIMKSEGTQLRSYCYILDCASAILAILLCGKTGDAYNISNKNSIVSIRDIAEELAIVSGVSIVFENPSDIEKKNYNPMNNSVLNSDKLEALGWKAVFTLKEGIMRTLKYYSEK